MEQHDFRMKEQNQWYESQLRNPGLSDADKARLQGELGHRQLNSLATADKCFDVGFEVRRNAPSNSVDKMVNGFAKPSPSDPSPSPSVLDVVDKLGG